MSHLAVSRPVVTRAFDAEAATPLPRWFETDSARRLLNAIAGCEDHERPIAFAHSQRFGRKVDTWREYDREDQRVISLGLAYGIYFEALQTLAPDMVVLAGFDTQVDEAIDNAIAAVDARRARDDEYARLLDEGLSIGFARALAFGEGAGDLIERARSHYERLVREAA